ncbi:dipeptide epimerase [Runella slithyformis]|uniref:Dipeptide epimerase n=1 Tax=Runella slithyformis (strain ATCC 29530 / DSM 19594 / LMG 11500 / NCIMB 11436 / LSU 4) TaxID=761193 RepID=A0A7U3ZJZ5_RUNSL|nr:dipeptide epimerase [Runella slithyformis]AEI48632.1 Mandelate racemase/muconate lactonizing protein [Runella slithyformis DSM 19594]
MQLFFHRFDLRLRHTFTIAHDSRHVQPTLVVELRDGAFSGFGEATSNKYYGITIESMIEALEAIRGTIESYDLQSPEDFWDCVYPFLSDNSFAQCALDEAANDLWAKKRRQKLYEARGFSAEHIPMTNYTIGIDTVEKMVKKMQELPWPIYKIKLGTPDDLAIIRELRKHTDAIFRVDANCAWSAGQAIRYSPELKTLGVEFIEQPLKADDWEGMKRVFEQSALPCIADESCIVEADVAKCQGYFHGVNVKLTKCGGLTPARRMIAEAKALGMQTMVGCMNETSVGISAIAHLLPLLDYVDMDGTLLITNDPASGVTFDFGKVIYASENGTGAALL